MCYYLYANVNQSAYHDDFFKICNKYNIPYKKIPTNELPFQPIESSDIYFRLTNEHCDCDTKIGTGQGHANELKEYCNWLVDLKNCRYIKYMSLLKHWSSEVERNPDEVIHIDDVDTNYLANLKDETFYKIQLFPKYY